MEKLRELTINALPPLSFFALVLCTWHGAVVLFEIKPFMLPGPLQVASAVGANLPRLLSATALTATGALLGFTLSFAFGFLVSRFSPIAPAPPHSGVPVQRLSIKLLNVPTNVKMPRPNNVQNRMQAKR